MKKLLSVALCILMVAALLPAVQPHAASAETSGQCGETLYWEFDENTGTLTITGSGDMDSYNSETVPWASYRAQITEAVLPDGLTSICDYAFYQCTNLSEITIPDSVTSIGSSALSSCTGLVSITVPCSSISPSAFSGCTAIANIHLTKGTGVMIDYYAYWAEGGIDGSTIMLYCTSPWYELRKNALTITLDEGIQNIGDSAFYSCTGLTEITIPDSVTSIGACAFYSCTGLSEITIPDDVTSIGGCAFSGCTGLTEITIPDGVTSINGSTFENCRGLTSISIGKNIRTIYSYAFPYCNNLKDIYYHGTRRMRNSISIESANDCLISATWHYLMPVSIELTTLPDKLAYAEGEALDVTGGIITAYYDYSIVEEEALTENMVSGFDATAVGTQTLTVTFEGKTATFEVTVFHTHIPGEPVHENEVEPTYTTPGYYDEVVYCTVCHAELSRETVQTDRLPFEGSITWNANDVKYRGSTPYVIANGSAQTPRFTVVCADGTVVDPENYDYEYRENTNAGTGYVFVTLKGDYIGDCRGHFKIYLPPTTATYVENTPYAIKITWNPVDGAAGYVIYRRAWSSTTNGWTEFKRWDNTTGTTYYDGHDDAHKVYAGTRYQYGVKAYFEQRTDPMTGALIGGNVGDNYNLGEVGPLKTTVRITARDLLTLTAGSNQLTAEWTASKNFTGYQIKYATDAGFTKNVKTVKIASPATSSTVLKSLNNGTLYYVTIRSYHEFEGMTYFGAWSNSLCVKPGSGMIVSPTHYRALLIGNNNYTSSPLYGCVNDVNAMAGMLNRLSMDYTGTVVKNARKATIIDQIRKTFAGATDSDVSLFYYSGHGVDAGGSGVNQGALVGVDGNIITMRELAAELSKFRGRIIVILDSCHSGAAIGKSQNADDVLDAFNDEVIEAFSGYYLETENLESGAKSGELKQSKFIVITAASITQSSYDGSFDGSGYRQGAFTAALIKGMGFAYPNGMYAVPLCFPADTNGDRKATLKELYTYAYNKAYSWTGSQRAQYYGNDNEVVFSR